ncbi:ankyrin [Skunkpox virus]|uniref:Ankyrin n=1 Tax=Skunkpox virus TaxID=160796 RepID=A0A1C9KBE9_9POXV|nr:ankyrin [Skunkpox virus]AOP31484.1 ankyrin [Skunkpox virus]
MEQFLLSYLEYQDVKLSNVKKILDKGIIPIDGNGNNALHCYCRNIHKIDINIINLLIEYGIDILHRNSKCLTPLGEYVNHHSDIDRDIVNILLHESNIRDFDPYHYILSYNIDIQLLDKLTKNRDKKGEVSYQSLVDVYLQISSPRQDVLQVLITNGEYRDDYSTYPYYYTLASNTRNALHNYIISHIDLPLSKDIISIIKNYYKTHTRGIDECGYMPIQYYWKNSVINIEIVKLLIDDVDCCAIYEDNIHPHIRGVLADYLNKRFRGEYNVDDDIVDSLIRTNSTINSLLDSSSYESNIVNSNVADFIRSITSYDSIEYNYDIVNKILKRFDKIVIQKIMWCYLHYSDNVSQRVLKSMLDNGAIINRDIIHAYFTNFDNVVNPDTVRFILEIDEAVTIQTMSNNGCYLFNCLLASRCNAKVNYENVVLDVLRVMIKYIEDINITDESGKTLLYYAVCYSCNELVKWLLENGANTSIITSKGSTIFNIVIRNTNGVSLTDMLIRYKPTLECMLSTMNNLHGRTHQPSLLRCIRYALLLDVNFPYPDIINEYKTEIDSYIDDINMMKNEKFAGCSMFDIFFNKKLETSRINYARHPIFLEYADTSLYRNEIQSIIDDTVSKRNYIDSLIEESGVFSRLPSEILYKIFSYTID